MFQEAGIVVRDNNIISYATGKIFHVEFDFMHIWEYYKVVQCDPCELLFYHTRPEGFFSYSDLDVNCIKGLNLSFGETVYFSLITFYSNMQYDLNHEQISYQYIKGEMIEVNNIPLSHDQLLFLKVLSYRQKERNE